MKLIADSAAAEAAAPALRTFNVTQAGTYRIRLTDLRSPAPLSALSAAVASSTATAARLSAPGTSAVADVSLVAGSYTVQPLATPATGSPGSFTVSVTEAGATAPLFQDQWAVAAAPATAPPGQSLLQAQFKVVTGGSYTVEVTDRDFPAALSSLALTITLHNDPNRLCTYSLGTPLPCALSLVAGSTYDLFVVAQADAMQLKGLYSLRVVGGPSGTSVAYGDTIPVGNLGQGPSFAVPAPGAVTLHVNDLANPAPLASFHALVTQGAEVLQSLAAPGSVSLAPATSGNIELFTIVSPDPAKGEGGFAAYATQGTNTLLDAAVPVVDTSHFGIRFSTTLATAGAYQFSATDFRLPTPLTEFTAVVEQRGAVLASGAGTNAIASAVNGALNMLVFAAVPPPAASSLFGIAVVPKGSTHSVYETTQGVGAAFRSQTVDIIASGESYVAQLTDLGFPTDFSQIWLIGTRGQTLVAQVVGSSKVVFDVPTAGTYVINILAQVGAGAHYGMYGWNLRNQPPAPTVTLTAAAATVSSGEPTTLTWSSTDATGCAASGAWTGQLATSGSQSTGPLSADSSFTLTCIGDGGSTDAVALVRVMQPSAGGGGALGVTDLALLALTASIALDRRRRRPI